MKRGDLATAVLAGDFGKPRPVLVIQSNLFEATATVTVLLISSTLNEASLVRVTVSPDSSNGLHRPSQIMMDKAMTVRRDKLGKPFGSLDDDTMLVVNRSLAVFLGIA